MTCLGGIEKKLNLRKPCVAIRACANSVAYDSGGSIWNVETVKKKKAESQ
jgi:hypothetical protein